jgi:hypothetical protein
MPANFMQNRSNSVQNRSNSVQERFFVKKYVIIVILLRKSRVKNYVGKLSK